MVKYTVAAMALMASTALAAPASSVETGPPIIYQTAPSAPKVTATTLGAPAATAGSKAKRQDSNICYPQPTGIAHKTSPDTASAFRSDPIYSSAATGAALPIGFSSIFTNTGASPQAPVGTYLGFTLLDTYDVQTCANKCNDIADCRSFNIYFERDPSVNPNDASCANPPSVTNIKCVWWSVAITKEMNTNTGQFANEFEVAIAGSNAYNGLPTQRGFRIKTDGSKTEFDSRWLAVSPGEGAAVALNPIQNKLQSSVFQFGPNGQLLQVYFAKNMAAVAPNQSGKWAALQYRAIGQAADYLNCSGDNLISCQSRSGWQYAGVCPNLAPRFRGLLYFGLPEKMPKDCKWIGLYIDTNIGEKA